jgi:hypothetical protein
MRYQQNYTYHQLAASSLLLVLLVILAGFAPASQAQHIAPAQMPPAPDITVALQAEPGIAVAPGSTLAYHIRMRNNGGKRESYTEVFLPYQAQQLTIVDSAFESSRDVVAALTDEQVVVRFGGMRAHEERNATIIARVAPQVPVGTVLPMQGTYGETRVRTNHAPVIVGQHNEHSDYVWLSVQPQRGPPGTLHLFCSDRYVPGEKVDPWLNRPDRGAWEIPGHAHPEVDDQGHVCTRFSSKGLPPGTYQMVVQGMESRLLGVADFVVEP